MNFLVQDFGNVELSLMGIACWAYNKYKKICINGKVTLLAMKECEPGQLSKNCYHGNWFLHISLEKVPFHKLLIVIYIP